MGWIEPLPSGNVRGATRLPNGQRRSATFKTETAATEWVDRIEAELVGYLQLIELVENAKLTKQQRLHVIRLLATEG